MRKTLALGIMLLSVTALFAGALIVHAQGPTNDDPVRALYAYDRPYTMQPASVQWFKFDWSGDRTKLINIVIPDGYDHGLEYRVYTPEQMSLLYLQDVFIGRGSSIMVPCDTGKCQSQDLIWVGTFPIAGTYFVEVLNPKGVVMPFHLLITGDGVSFGNEPPSLQIVATLTPTSGLVLPTLPATATPTATLTITTTPGALATFTSVVTTGLATLTPIFPAVISPVAANPLTTATPLPPANDSPYNAIYIPDNRPQSIAANGELWYKFDYTGDRSQITISLPNGNAWGFDFKVYISENAFQVYTQDKFVGRGSAVNQPCATGTCTADDLTWIGNFPVPGTYYVRVINTKPLPQTFIMRIVGTAVNILGQ